MLWTHFSTLKQPKRRISMAALMKPLPTEAAAEEKTTRVRTIAIARTTRDRTYSRKLAFTHQDTSSSTQTAKKRQQNHRSDL